MNFPMTKGIAPLPKSAVTNVTPSSLCQVSTGANFVTPSITVTPLYTTGGHNLIAHNKSISPTLSLQAPAINSNAVITSMAASLLSATCKPFPTVGQLLQSNQLLVRSQKVEQSTTTA